MNSSHNLTDNEVAFAAINLLANKPTGPEPDWLEIHDWHLDLLDDERAEQVLSHVANNPEYFQMWRDICEAAEFLEQNPLDEAQTETVSAPQSTSANPAAWDLVGWLRKGAKAIFGQPLPAIGGAVAATVLAVMIVPKLINTPQMNPGDMVNNSLAQYSALGAPLPQTALSARNTRSMAGVLGNMSEEAVEKHQLNSGFRQAFDQLNIEQSATTPEVQAKWLPWRQALPESALDCSLAADQQHCTQVSANVSTLGQWALITHLTCTQPDGVPKDFQQRQVDTLNTIKNLDSMKASALLNPLLQSSSDNGCSIADSLISIASE